MQRKQFEKSKRKEKKRKRKSKIITQRMAIKRERKKEKTFDQSKVIRFCIAALLGQKQSRIQENQNYEFHSDQRSPISEWRMAKPFRSEEGSEYYFHHNRTIIERPTTRRDAQVRRKMQQKTA